MPFIPAKVPPKSVNLSLDEVSWHHQASRFASGCLGGELTDITQINMKDNCPIDTQIYLLAELSDQSSYH